jgi:hypothetical protein
VATTDAPLTCPGPGWQLLAGGGRRGDRGPPGERGSPGPSGPPGETLTIVGWQEDFKFYSAAPIMSDGSVGPAISMLRFFEQFQRDTQS